MRLRSLVLTILSSLLGSADAADAAELSQLIADSNVSAAVDREERRQSIDLESQHSAWPVAKDPRLVAAVDALLNSDDAQSGGRVIADLLGQLTPFTRTHVVCLWALSPHRPLRLGVARSAPYVLPTPVGLPTAIRRLASDEDPEIRAAARRAQPGSFAFDLAIDGPGTRMDA